MQSVQILFCSHDFKQHDTVVLECCRLFVDILFLVVMYVNACFYFVYTLWVNAASA